MLRGQRATNTIFVVIISAVLFSVIGYEVVQHAIPSLNTPQNSVLEGREYQRFPKPTLSTVANGSFQQSFSRFVADDIPLRDEVIVSNAAVQRNFIELANLPFGFKAYPTFFGAKHAYLPATNRVSAMPSAQNSDLKASINKAAATWSTFIERYPDTRWFVFMPDWAPMSLVGPIHDLIANPADRAYWESEFFAKLPESCTYIDGAYENAEEWEAGFFRTDHHWQIQGALPAYKMIAERLGVVPIEFKEFYETNSGDFWGSYARLGLCLSEDGDVVWDVIYNPSALKVRVDGEDVDATFLNEGFYDPYTRFSAQTELPNTYSEWFHFDYGLIEIENENAETDKTLLIIGDSFSDNIDRFLAESYRTVCAVDPRYFTGDINQLITLLHPQDALIILSAYWNDETVLKSIE